jgi:hypothetical protein
MSDILLNNHDTSSGKRPRETDIDDIDALEPETNRRHIDLTHEMQMVYMQKADETKVKIDDLAAQITVRKGRMSTINEIIAAINSATSEENTLDLTNQDELKTKLKRAKEEFGVDIPKLDDNKVTYSSLEKDRLLQNLELVCDSWDKENHPQLSKMEVYQKELDRIMNMLTSTRKEESQAGTQILRNIKG